MSDITNRYLRQQERMDRAREFLGGSCVSCGLTVCLQFDHIDPTTKRFSIGSGGSRGDQLFWEEVKKCQLLCLDCHKQKTVLDMGKRLGVVYGDPEHGTSSRYYWHGCRCPECREWKREYSRSGYLPTPREQSSHCKRGHELTTENTRVTSKGGRICRACANENSKAHQARKGVKVPNPRSLKTHCPQGHPYAGENLIIHRDGGRACRQCQRDRYWRAKLLNEG